MSCGPYFDQCRKNVGRPVGIRTRDGRFHRGVIADVNNSHVFLRPLGNRNPGGFGYGLGGFGGYGGGYGRNYAVPLAYITALSLLFFW
ncbi:hypothetical protein CFK37_02980 [Virgibacillus phasianinus]|uniref:Uncharacterized protein n=1 Tax=Virgibacillus phasianinus TaxID=2017483 RepID=A0A220U005_9BACI|nr:hypothetical protein [Virgibacillus phasianinus]ASK61231.1 hypothetical protein CFK37_02980 [Virgibacillus phasianinus]